MHPHPQGTFSHLLRQLLLPDADADAPAAGDDAHAADDGDVIGDRAEVGEELADFGAGFTEFLELNLIFFLCQIVMLLGVRFPNSPFMNN